MSTAWPVVPLGEVLTKSEAWIDLAPDVEYQEVTVRLWGRGVTQRRQVTGAEIGSDRRLQVRPRQFILSRIDARNGAFGLVPEELDGAVVSNDFPTFDVHEDRMQPEYLGWLSRTATFVEACKSASEGTTNRVRLKEDKFLRMPLSLPPLSEQQRIVTKIERLAELVDDARTVRQAVDRDLRAILQSEARRVFDGLSKEYPSRTIENVCLEIIDCLHSNPVYSEFGPPTVRSPDVGWGRLLLESARRTSEQEYLRRTVRSEPRPGDIILVREGGGTGKAGLVEEGMRLSLGQRVMQLRPDPAQVDPVFLLQQWLSPRIQEDHIAVLSKGSASPHLNIGAIRKFQVAVPPRDMQNRVIRHLSTVREGAERLGAQHAKAGRSLDAIIPALLDRAFKGEL